jgi:hypothetical protein
MPLECTPTAEFPWSAHPKPRDKPALQLVEPEPEQPAPGSSDVSAMLAEYVQLHKVYADARRELEQLKARMRELADKRRKPGESSVYISDGREGPCVVVLYGKGKALLSETQVQRVRQLLGKEGASECLVPFRKLGLRDDLDDGGVPRDVALRSILEAMGLVPEDYLDIQEGLTVAGLDGVLARHPELAKAIVEVSNMTGAKRATVKIHREGK